MPDRPLDSELERLLGYHFLNRDLLTTALTHPSAVNEPPHIGGESNGRLEFLGDAVLGLVVSEMLYERRPPLDEGGLTDERKAFVANDRVRSLAEHLERDLDLWLYLGGTERKDGGRGKPKRLGDALEAIIGAIHLDAGPAHATKVVRLLLQRYEMLAAPASS